MDWVPLEAMAGPGDEASGEVHAFHCLPLTIQPF